MRKELVYSLLAVAAGPVVPVTVNAAVVPTGAVQDKNWSGADKVESGVVYISTGEPISCNLGTLEIGKYKLIIGSFSKTTDITVTVEGQSKTFAAADGTGTVEFELTAKKDVTFTVTPKDAATCEISKVSLDLDADFEGIAKTLLSLYNNAYNTVSKYGYVAEDNAEVLKITKQLKDINAIDQVKDGDAKAYADVYTKYALWNGAEGTDMYKNIVAAQEAADPKEIAFQATALETSLAATKKDLDDEKTPAYAKNGTLDDYNKKDGSKGLTAKYNDLLAQAAAYKAGSEVEGYAAIAAEITALNGNIAKAQTAGGGNTKAYETVKAAIETAQTNYQAKYKTITTETIPVTANKNLAIDDINETLRADAIAELQKQLDAIGLVNQANEEAYEAGTSKDFEAKGTYTTDLKAAADKIDAIKAAYATHVKRLKAAYDSYDTEFKNVADAKEKNKVAIEKDGKGVAEAVTAMDDALAAVAAAIEANKGAAKIDALNLNAYGEKATDLIKAVEDAIAALNKACADITTNEIANTEMTDAIAKLDKKLAGYVEAINKAKYADYDPLAGGYAADYAYVQKLGTDLVAAIKLAYDESKAAAYQTSGFKTASTAYETAIEALNTAITADQANYKAVYDAINGEKGARAAYNALLKKVQGLTIYTSADAETVYSKAWMDAELKKITDIEDAIKKALALTDGCADVVAGDKDKGEHQKAIQALKADDVNAVTTELNAKNVDGDINTANTTYEAKLSADALANLKNSVNVQLADINTRIAAIKTEVGKNTYGLTNSEINTKVGTIETDYKKLDANQDGVYDDAAADVAKLTAAQEAIDKIETALSDLEKLAASAADKVKANDAALKALGEAVNKLQTEYNQRKAAADKDDKDSSTDWAAAFTAAQGAIDGLYKSGVIVDKDVKASYDAETLQESDYTAKVTAIQEKIAAAKTIADNAQANFKANADLVKLAGEVGKAITDAKAAAKTADATAYTNFYQKEFEDAKASYQKSKADIDDKITAAKTADATIAAAKPEAAEKMSAAQKAALTTELNNLKDAVGKVEAAVKANKAAYDKQKLALDGDGKDNIGAKKTYNEVSMKLATLDETTESKSWKEEMNGYNDQLIAKEEDVEAYYKKGQSQTTGEDKDGLTNAINDLKSKIEIIKGKIDGEYNASVQADNEAKLAEVREAIAAAKQAFKDANEYTAQFKNLTSDVFAKAISNADAAAPKLNSALTTFPTKIDAAEAQAQKDFDAVNASPKVWDYAADLKAVTDLTADINSALDAYKKAVKDGIDATYTTKKKGYDAALAAGKTTIANFTIDDSALEATAVDAFFADVNKLIGDMDEAYEALDVAELDELVQKADANLKNMIDADVTAAADDVIRPLITECDEIVAEAQANLTGDELENFNKEVETLEEHKEMYNASYEKNQLGLGTNFKAFRNLIKNWRDNNSYSNALLAEEIYEQLQTLISEREAALAAATAEIEKYAAAGDLKKADLATIQKTIDAFKKTVENRKSLGLYALKSLINAKKEGSKENDDNLNLQNNVDKKIETALTTSLKTAEGNYLVAALNDVTSAIYDLESNGGDATQIAAFKDKVQNAKTGLKTRLDADIADTKKKAEDLLPYEKEISDLLAEINTANNVDNSAIVEDLNTLIAAVEAKIALTDYNEEIQQSLSEKAHAIQTKLDAVKADIAAAENVAFSKDNFENTIAAINKETDALIDEADLAQKKADNAQKAAETAVENINTDIETLETRLAEAKARLDDTNQYEFVSSTTFKTKLAQIEQSIANIKADAEAAAAEGTVADFIKDKDLYLDPVTNAGAGITDVLNSAAKRELKAIAENLRAEIDGITYNENDYTDGDLASIEALIKAVDTKVGKDSYYDEETKATVAATGLFATAAKETDANLDTDKETAAQYAQDIEDIKALIQSQSNVDPEPEVVPGDITGTGEVTGDDFDQFAQDLVNGNVPAPGDPDFAAYDANGDGQITVADLQAILNLMVGNNADGTPKTAARSKQTAEEASGTLSVKATQMGNVTRLAVVLNSTSEFTGFQMDVLAPAGTRVVGESLGENMPEMMLLSSDLATSAHRIVGFASNGTLSNGTVLYIDVEGAGDVKFADVVFTTAKAKSVTMNLGDATGINGIEAEQNDGIFYDLGGKVMRTLKKGINIIRNANGTTKKVVVK